MYIDTINIKSFGPFEDLSLKFIPKGINIVFGEHGTGKSQIVAGIIASISPQPELFIKLNEQFVTESEFKVTLIENDQVENLILSKSNETTNKNYVKKNKSGILSDKIYQITKDDKMPSILFNRDGYTIDSNMVLKILEEMPIKGDSHKLWYSIRNMAREGMNSNIKGAWPYVIEYIKEFNFRRNSLVSIPLIIDSPNWWTDESFLLIIAILEEVAKHDQVILFLNPSLQELVVDNQIVYTLPNRVTTKMNQLFGESNEDVVWQNLNKI